MTRMTNTTRRTLNFVVKGPAKNGVPPTDHIEPGETKDLDVDMDSANVRGHILAGTITVADKIADKVTAAVAEDPARGR